MSDTGKGIPADELPTIFDEYRQAEGSESSVQTTVLEGAGEASLRGLCAAAISDHHPKNFSQRLEPCPKKPGDSLPGFHAAHLQDIVFEDRFCPGLTTYARYQEISNDAAFSQAQRSAGYGGGVDHVVIPNSEPTGILCGS